MSWWRPPKQYGRNTKRNWSDTPLGHNWEIKGLLAKLWMYHFFPTLGLEPANDRDHVRW